jgi:exopolyphosphatase/guanosine-5'-triphosphate,3'-diphosphate pyrophosphatase
MLQLIRNDDAGDGYQQLAVVDLGSNSFRLQIGRLVDGQVYPLDSLKESVRLAAGLTADKRLDADAQQRALAALRRFGERLRGFAPGTVRAVATNTLRVAKNAADFLPRAEQALGFSIEVIGGREEARLVYSGATHSLPAAEHRRLVVDVGGGSTEFIVGRQAEPQLMESLYMGCVSYSLRFFPDGQVDKKRFRDAQLAAAQEVSAIARPYQRLGWNEAIATSGSAHAIARLIEVNRLDPGNAGAITRNGLETLRALMIRAGSAAAMELDGLPTERLPVLAGGLAILCAVCSELSIERLDYASGALRLGVFYDLLGRTHHCDLREATVRQFMRRYQVDGGQAQRVESTALRLLGQLAGDSPADENDLRFLRWAARLHEIGISIAHSGHHKHGAYILSLADMPGFSKPDQARLAQLVLGQRGKLEKLAAVASGDASWRSVFCLRLALVLHRSRDDLAPPDFRFSHERGAYRLDLPAGWLAANPLSASALADEAAAWLRAGFALVVGEHDLSDSAVA